MGSNSEGGRLYRKMSLPARFGSLRKSPKPTNTTPRAPAPDPPELRGKPPALPPKPPVLLPKPSPLHPNPPELTAEPPKLIPKPSPLNPKPSDHTLEPLELTSNPPELTPEPSTRMLLSKGHATAILKGCEHFRSDETLCDVTLESGDGSETLPVHRVIMASASGYFKAAFTGEMKGESVVKLQGVSGRGLRTMVDFVYTGGLRLDMDSLQDTLEAARYLQVQPVLQLCNQLLSSELTVDNCVEVGSVAVELQLEEVLGRVQEFVCANFSALVQSGRHLQLSAACLSHALSSDSLWGFTEVELYRVARDWLDRDPAGRGAHTHALMSRVRFPLMAPADLLRISQEDAGLRGDPACAQLLLEASSYQTLPFLQPALQSERTRLRSDSAHLLLLGGVTHRHLAVSRQLCYYDDGAEVWRALRPLDEPRYQHGVAVLGGFLFVVGGQGQYDSKGATATDSAYRYDPRGDRWLQLAPLGEKRTFFHLSVLGGRLYAAGGRNASGELDSVERYDFSRNEWTFVSPMAEPVYGHAGAVHQQLMYISGGITQDTFRKDLWRYDAAQDEWRRCADMAAARGLHCMSAAGGRLYALGGNAPVGEGDYADVLSVEAYSPAADQWTAAAPMALGQSDAGVAWFGGLLYVAGGYQWRGRCMVDAVQRYDPERDAWDEAFGVPEPVGGARICAMPLPPTHSPLQSHAHHYPLDMPSG
ncbi:kelch-like protein 9 [Anguilla rostrata]|uniref:kelch-like protein 9 n=1 Tax=Anguilla rostrata TaxID=7938 RepID=UPI0030CA6204